MEIELLLIIVLLPVLGTYVLVGCLLGCARLVQALVWCARLLTWAAAWTLIWLWVRLPLWGEALRRATARWARTWAAQMKRRLHVQI